MSALAVMAQAAGAASVKVLRLPRLPPKGDVVEWLQAGGTAETVTKAGIEWATWHDLRHTFASRLAMTGHNDGTIAALLRHSTTILVKRYANLSPSHLQVAVEGVARFVKRPVDKGEPKALEQKPEPVLQGTVTRTVTVGCTDDKENV